MKLKLHTDFALRVLIYLAHRDEDSSSTGDIATAFDISKNHLTKVVQDLVRTGYVISRPGRHGGIRLARPADEIDVAEVIGILEGRQGVLECVASPEVCVLEPGCRLRRRLMQAEAAFYDTLSGTTIADVASPRGRGGVRNLDVAEA